MKTLFIGSALALLFGFQPAHAFLYLEPYGGYASGKGTAKISLANVPVLGTVNRETSDTIAAPVFGGKLGLSLFFLAFGGEYQSSSAKSDGNSMTQTDTGAFAMLKLAGFKIGGTYFFASTAKGGTLEVKGNGFKAGIGFKLIPFVWLNIDYFAYNYSKATVKLEAPSTLSSYSAKTSGTMVTLSIPIDI